MKTLCFDTGPVISLALNGLLWIIEPLKKRFGGEFLITKRVKHELVDRPIESKKFKLEALQVLQVIESGALQLASPSRMNEVTSDLMEMSNNMFFAKGRPLKLVHQAEIECLAACMILGSEGFVVDERTTRLLIEKPDKLAKRLKRKLHTHIRIDHKLLKAFQKRVARVKLIRSVELVTIAFELGILDNYVAHLPHAKRTLLEALLWGVKINGCAVTEEEIAKIIKEEKRRKTI